MPSDHQVSCCAERLEPRHVHASKPGELDHRAGQRIKLKPLARLEVLQHRRPVISDSLGSRHTPPDADRRCPAECECHGQDMLHQRGGERTPPRAAADLGERCSGEHAQGIEHRVAHQLQSGLCPDVSATRGPIPAPDWRGGRRGTSPPAQPHGSTATILGSRSLGGRS
jgi:hypothetical protein